MVWPMGRSPDSLSTRSASLTFLAFSRQPDSSKIKFLGLTIEEHEMEIMGFGRKSEELKG